MSWLSFGRKIVQLSVMTAAAAPLFLGCHGSVTIVCVDPQAQPGGVEHCSNGAVRRVDAAASCPIAIPRALSCEGATGCKTDADCVAAPYGMCNPARQSPDVATQPAACGCVYGCKEDADCGPGFVCRCGESAGQCVAAACRSNTDCRQGEECLLSSFLQNSCTSEGQAFRFDCTSAADECTTNQDCGDKGNTCLFEGGHFKCEVQGCFE